MATEGTKRVSWDEANLAEHEAAAGVLYGTRRVDESITPFLYYSESVSRDEGLMHEFVPGVGPTAIAVDDLIARLGKLASCTDFEPVGFESPPAPWIMLRSRTYHDESFYYNPTTQVACWELPQRAEDEQHASSGHGEEVQTRNAAGSTEDRRVADGAEAESGIGLKDGSGAGSCTAGAGDDGDDDEVPIPSSRLTKAADCAAQYARQLHGLAPETTSRQEVCSGVASAQVNTGAAQG